MKNLNRILFCIAVLSAVILIADIPVVSSATLNIIDASTNELIASMKAGIDNNDNYVKKRVDVNGNEVKIGISNTENHSVMGALLYLCGDKPPSECAVSKPIEFTGQVNASLNLNEIQKNGKAGLLTVVKSNQSNIPSEDFNRSWIAGWDYIENGVVQKAPEADIDIYTSKDASDLKDFIKIYGMIPASFIDKLDFKGKKIQQMRGEAYRTGRSVERINITNPKKVSELERDQGYIFAFPSDQSVYSPVSFYNIEKSCRNADCEIGENYQNCWFDCRCPEGQVASETGCVPSGNVKLIIDDIDPHPIDCLTEDAYIDTKSGSSCQPTSGSIIKLHIQNAPVNYTCPQFSFGLAPGGGPNPKQFAGGLSCMPKDEEDLIQQFVGGQNQIFCSGSKYECFFRPPPLDDVKTTTTNRAMWVGMYTNIETKKGAESILVYNITKLKFDVLGLDLSSLGLEDAQKAIEKSKQDQKEIDHITDVVNDISSTFFYIEATFIVCWAIASVFAWTGVGAAVALWCGAHATSWGIITIIVYIIMLLLNLLVAACTGVPYSHTIIPQTPRWLAWVGDRLGINLDWKGLSIDILSEDASKEAGKKISNMPSALKAILSPAMWIFTEATGLAKLCGRMAKVEDRIKQHIEESSREAEIKIKGGLSRSLGNLIWAKGSETGKTATVCNGENVEGYYDFGAFGCSDVWFSFNSKNRPVCNFTSNLWVEDPDKVLNGKIFNDTCYNSSSTEYTWMPQDENMRPELGVRSYNATDSIFLLFNKTASSLFSNPVNGSELKIFTSCDSQIAGQRIESEFKLVNYSEICKEKGIAQV